MLQKALCLLGAVLLSTAMLQGQSSSTTVSTNSTQQAPSTAISNALTARNNPTNFSTDCRGTPPDWRAPHRHRKQGQLPRGFLHTQGSQIVDCHNRPVRIAAVGWASCFGNGIVGWVPDGLNDAPLQAIMDNVADIGFNTVRIHWADPSVRGALPYTYEPGSTNGFNPQLEGKNSMQVFDAIVRAAGKAGLKIIFDHNANEYQCGQQTNGLWFDSGPGSNGTDGRVTGTVTAAQFQADTVALAKRYAGNSTVIGYDLDNEPHPDGSMQSPPVNWMGRANGDTETIAAPGNPTDIAAMYQTVGNAVEKAAPGVLIIAEGFQDYGAGASWGDLRYVRDHPLKLKASHRLVYSIHNYPYTISGYKPDSGPAAIAQWESVWGFVQTDHIAPVWIGEMVGVLFDGTTYNNPESPAALSAYADTLFSFMNGTAPGGPRFSCKEQPMSGDWWSWGYYPYNPPQGILAEGWANPAVRPGVKPYLPKMFFKKRRCDHTLPDPVNSRNL
jgi:aryl-phospho-beta-D-glucosidase BglC (GH1 family)